GGVADVEGEKADVRRAGRAELGLQAFELVEPARGDEEPRALAGEGAGARGADPSARPGDENDLSGKTRRHGEPPGSNVAAYRTRRASGGGRGDWMRRIRGGSEGRR